MNKSFLTPLEIASVWITIGKKKANLDIYKMILLGILAGMFIGFGAHANIVVTQTLGKVDVGLAKFLGAAIFPVGIILVIIAGAELFTGNNLMSLAVLKKDVSLKNMITNWIFVYIGNFIGSIILVYLLFESGLYGQTITDKAISIAQQKISLSLSQAVIRGVLCNILVVLACWMQAGARDISGKIFALWFPVMLFVLSGFEHSVANMFFIPLGKILGANITWTQLWFNNIIPVTIGNIIGGAVIVPLVYWYVYLNMKDKRTTKRSMAA